MSAGTSNQQSASAGSHDLVRTTAAAITASATIVQTSSVVVVELAWKFGTSPAEVSAWSTCVV